MTDAELADSLLVLCGVGATVLAALMGALVLMWVRNRNNHNEPEGNPNSIHQLWPLVDVRLGGIQDQITRQTGITDRTGAVVIDTMRSVQRVLDRIEDRTKDCPAREQGRRQ